MAAPDKLSAADLGIGIGLIATIAGSLSLFGWRVTLFAGGLLFLIGGCAAAYEEDK